MKNKLLFTFIALLLVIFTLTSCDGILGGDPNNQNKPDPPQGEPTKIDTIVFFDPTLDNLIMPVRTKMMDIVMPVTTVTDPTIAPTDGEVVFGESDRAITAAAKQKLAELLEADRDNDTGYVIYSDGKNVAVYWMHENMASLAISDFVEECIDDNRLIVEAGVVKSEHFELSEYEKEMYWLNLESEAPADVVAAFRTVYAFYEGDNLLDWIANLWDPEVGGFYYSRSARDYEGFLPDIESTNFALGLLSSLGAMTDRNTQLPLDMQLAILNFAKSMQSKNDGYFYHKQWAQDKSQLNVDRYGRDLATATSLITSFYIDTDGDGVKEKQYPNYCIPGSTKCKEHTDTDYRCTFPVETVAAIADSVNATSPLSSGVSAAVSKVSTSVVTPTASNRPDYSSAAAFRKWLEEYNKGDAVKENSGNAHNIAELRLEIIAHGYLDVVLDYLDEVQAEIFEEQVRDGETPTGAWQKTANFRAVWGIYKYLAIYNVSKAQSREIDLKYVPYMLDTCITVISAPAESTYHVNDVMNQWTAISRIITNVEWYHGKDKAEEVKQYVRENVTAQTILGNLEKVRPFKVADGSFGYTTEGKSLATIYGVPISLGLVEGDLNSAVLAHNVYRTMYTAIGYTPVPLCEPSDLDRFLGIIEGCEPIDKIEIEAEELTFDDVEDMTLVTSTQKTPEFSLEVTADPTDSGNNVLHFTSGTAAAQADSAGFIPSKYGNGCIVAEFKMYVSSETDDGYIFQISMGSASRFTMHKSGSKIILKARPDFDANVDIEDVLVTTTDTWFKVRIERYDNDGTDEGKPITKIFLDDEYLTSTGVYANSHLGNAPNSSFGKMNFYSMRVTYTDVYFDDCYFALESKIYNAENNNISDSRG